MGTPMIRYENRDPAGLRLTAGPVQGLLGSLVAAGWTQAFLAGELGMNPGNFAAMMRQERVTVGTHQAVMRLYGRLAGEAPPEGAGRERADACRARRIAAARGWQPPPGHARYDVLPVARPGEVDHPGRWPGAELVEHYGELAAAGLSRGEAARRLRVNRAALTWAIIRFDRRLEAIMTETGKPLRGKLMLAEADWLASYGLDREEIARRLGVSWKTIEQAVTRRNRRLAKAAAGAAGDSSPEAAAEVILLEPGSRAGCGTILAVLLHQELGEPVCRACTINAAERKYPIRTRDDRSLAA